MMTTDPGKLRNSAHRYRSMASDGDDPHLKAALRQLADEFEREAAEMEEQTGIVANAPE
jgi:hypothetical protein